MQGLLGLQYIVYVLSEYIGYCYMNSANLWQMSKMFLLIRGSVSVG